MKVKSIVYGALALTLCLAGVPPTFSSDTDTSKTDTLDIKVLDENLKEVGEGERKFSPGQSISLKLYISNEGTTEIMGSRFVVFSDLSGSLSWVSGFSTWSYFTASDVLTYSIFAGTVGLESLDGNLSIFLEDLRVIYENEEKNVLIVRGRIPRDVPSGNYIIVAEIPVVDKKGRKVLQGKSEFTININAIIEGTIAGILTGLILAIPVQRYLRRRISRIK